MARVGPGAAAGRWRSGGAQWLRPGRLLPALLGLLGLLAGTTGVQAQTTPAHLTGIELTRPTQQALERVPDLFLAWQGAFFQDDRKTADGVTEDLRRLAEQLGMRRLPDVSRGMLASAVQAAREDGDFARASWAVEAAEQLDPGRPETAFARATLHRLEGSYFAAVRDAVQGYLRLRELPQERVLWTFNAQLLLLLSLVVAGSLFVALQLAARGPLLLRDLGRLLGGLIRRPIALLLGGLLLLVPLALSFGVLWFVLLCSVLLWGYATKSERVILVLVWLVLGSAPLLLAEQQRHIAMLMSPPSRALYSLEERSLSGSLFADIRALRRTLPDPPALQHLLADLHRGLGQWEQARSLYQQLLQEEPSNAGAEINVGTYYFEQGDFGRAQIRFEKATRGNPQSAEAFFNLSQAYTSQYLFEDASRAMDQAQQLQPELVGQWLQGKDGKRVRTVDAGFERIPELRRMLVQAAQETEQGAASLQRTLVRQRVSLFAALGLVLTAFALHVARRGTYSQPRARRKSDSQGSRENPAALLARVLLPGWTSIHDGKGLLAFAALLPPVFLLLLPFSASWGYRIPWGQDPGSLLTYLITTVGLVGYLLIRLLLERRS